MPVTLNTASHSSTEWRRAKVPNANNLLKSSSYEVYGKCKWIIQHSFPDELFEKVHISPSDNGFVSAVVDAYCDHHHLTLRPEDVWFSILTQFSFFVNAHAEDMRSYFVAHEGKKELEIKTAAGSIHTIDFGYIAQGMTKLIEQNVVDRELRTWIMPDFSTTTETDRVVAAIVMMGTLQEYFSYKCTRLCGIPTVTLLGERADWEAILRRIEKLPEFGKEPAQFARLLRPVLRRFVASFDEPNSPEILDFWSKCADKQPFGSGSAELSGWITAFCFWTEKGRCLYKTMQRGSLGAGCELDDVVFHKIDIISIPHGFASVPLAVDDNGTPYDTVMLAGLVGIQATSSEPVSESQGDRKPDSIQPLSGWWMYEKVTPEQTTSEGTN